MLISIDTEFERRRTYRPVLSIVQVKEEGKDAVIYDVRADKNKTDNKTNDIEDIMCSEYDLQRLVDILSNDDNIKIIHACKQDMEAIYSHFHIVIDGIKFRNHQKHFINVKVRASNSCNFCWQHNS